MNISAKKLKKLFAPTQRKSGLEEGGVQRLCKICDIGKSNEVKGSILTVSDMTVCIKTLCLMKIFIHPLIHSFMPRNEPKEWE